jgi:hypothetical protein
MKIKSNGDPFNRSMDDLGSGVLKPTRMKGKWNDEISFKPWGL